MVCYWLLVINYYKIQKIIMQRLAKGRAPQKQAKTKEHDEETINELKEAFKIFDSKNTGISFSMQVRSMPGNSKLS